MTLGEFRAGLIQRIQSGSPKADADALLCSVLGCSRTSLITGASRVLSDAEISKLESFAARRNNGEPIAYITGTRGFWDFDVEVNSSTLIPRPETEFLVETALGLFEGGTFLDLGTGTGAILIAISRERPSAVAFGTELVPEAAALARRNCVKNGVKAKIMEGSWYEPVEGMKFDLIVSNPPYIDPYDHHLNEGDVRFEPRSALVSGLSGLDDLKLIIGNAPQYLNDSGHLAVEHGWDQGFAVRKLFSEAGFTDIGSVRDYGGHERVTYGIISDGAAASGR